MRLVKFRQGRLSRMLLPISSSDSYDELKRVIADTICQCASSNGNIDSLSVDFSGRYIPLTHVNDAPIVAALLAAYVCDRQDSREEQVEEKVS